eukprot:CAMPEP_0113819174 /NCGR_PEP_ID=MMETSP0328-20130328/608_1 /TAXON_ID=39455 /ORGANISM="Alexandrium minutum" /LENGTH=370 /DNA_ID=CAMNT_0000787109 /DNA_START=97 /DNA_END=1205 /DNA_ORIENTATION=- /assembly_acc=CAM_ASM_000350
MAQYDVILFGATGFTGSLALDYLLTKGDVNFAICGRNRQKLEGCIAGATKKPDIFVLDVVSSSQSEIQEVVRKAKCVCTTVGPFALYGEPLVQACAELGVDYVDTSGESTFFRAMIEKYDALAKQRGARVVVHCGQDCIPWDLTVWKLWKLLGSELTGVKILCEMKANASGGTLITALHNLQAKAPKSQLGFDPLYLVDGQKSDCSTQIELPKGSQFYQEAGQKGGPWIMGPVMANAVRRSNALLNMVPGLKYHEAMLASSDVGTSTMMTVAMGTCIYMPFMLGFWQGLGVIPQAGDGPSRESMDQGFLTLTAYADTAAKSPKCKAVMKFYTDPGYKDTARMAVEAALSLVALPKSQKAGGVYSPAAACG